MPVRLNLSYYTGKSGDIISLWAFVTGKTKLFDVVGLISKWLNAERFIYRDENGKDIIYVYLYNDNSYYAWNTKTRSSDSKPLFNIREIIKSDRVVIVKGEKC